MPYKNLTELPEQVLSSLPLEAQRIYAAAYNMAWEQFGTLQDTARREKAEAVAWSAVGKVFEQHGEANTWRRKMPVS